MAISDADLWHQVHAQREDGVPAMFLVRDVEPRDDQPQIFVIQMPYAVTDVSRLPDAAGYRRLDAFQEQWIEPACAALGWTFVAWKSEDGSFFLYLYGDGDPNMMLEKLSPFDPGLGFFNDRDAEWNEYAALRELVEQAEAAPDDTAEGLHIHTADCDHDHGDGEHHHSHDHGHGHAHDPAVRRPRARAETVRETRLNPARAKRDSPQLSIPLPEMAWEEADDGAGKPATRSKAGAPSAKRAAKSAAAKKPVKAAGKAAVAKASAKRAKAAAAKKPAAKAAKPAAKATKPAAKAAKPAAKATKPAAKAAKPAAKAATPAAKAATPAAKAATPAAKATKPAASADAARRARATTATLRGFKR